MGEEPSANRYHAAIPSLRKFLQYLDASGSGAQPDVSCEPSSSTSSPSAPRASASPTFPDVVREPQLLNNQVTLVKNGPLGVGGFGYVHADFSASIARELRLLNGLKHENILELHGICTDLEGCEEIVSEETPALVMSLCLDIDAYLFRNPWSRTRVHLMVGVIRGLSYLHSLDIIHGDVKPANILVKIGEDDEPIGVLADFGHSRVDNQSGYTTQFTSTPLFTAPELYFVPGDNFADDTDTFESPTSATGPTATKASDMYSFALTLLTDLGTIERIRKRHRTGAHSTVYAGTATVNGTSTNVAIKIFNTMSPKLKDASLSKALQKFSPSWIHLRHANIARFYGLDEEQGLNFIPAMVYDYYERGNIMDYLSLKYGAEGAADNDVRNSEALRLMTEAADGLDYLHQLDPRVIHTDFRGANIMVDDDAHARVADVGLLLALPEDETNYIDTVHPAGLVRWAGPDLWNNFDAQVPRASNYTTATDVYAYGMTLVEVFSNRPPFTPAPRKDGQRIRYTDIQALRSMLKGVRPPIPPYLERNAGLRTLVKLCWDADPAKRPSMQEVCHTLANLPPHDPIHSNEPPTGTGWYFFQLFGRVLVWPFSRIYRFFLPIFRVLRFAD
ncbi:hypothetical protein ONZ45_g15714 [Pleurotus djamor]|nr:hypothetical protein ONZ45_g15714 [Pleurotus djamor]